MTKYDLYCLIFYALDSIWDETKNQDLGNFLSGANPFLFDGIGSADPAIYTEFNKLMPDSIPIAESFSLAKAYIDSLNIPPVKAAFSKIKEQSWEDAVSVYISDPS